MSARLFATDQLEPVRIRTGLYFALLLLAGAAIIIPRFFFEIRADVWPGVLLYIGLAGLFLVVRLWLRSHKEDPGYWRAAFAIFTFAIATPLANELGRGLGGWFITAATSPEQSLIVRHLFSALMPALGIVFLNFLSGERPEKLYLTRGKLRVGLAIGLIFFVALSALSLMSADSLAGREIAASEIARFLPRLGAGVLLNGF